MHTDDDVRGPAGAWPLAVLLTDDRADAEALVTDALAAHRRDSAAVRRAVVHAAPEHAGDSPATAPVLRDPSGEALTAALRAHGRARNEQAQIARLRAGTRAPVTILPFLDDPTGAAGLAHRLAAELAPRG